MAGKSPRQGGRRDGRSQHPQSTPAGSRRSSRSSRRWSTASSWTRRTRSVRRRPTPAGSATVSRWPGEGPRTAAEVPRSGVRAGGPAPARRRGAARPSGRRGGGRCGRRDPTPRSRRSPRRGGERTGAETLATPASRSATLCAQPRRRTSSRTRSPNADGSPDHAASTFAPRPGVHRHPHADRHGVAQTARRLGGRHADPGRGVQAVAAVELDALAGEVAQAGGRTSSAASSRGSPCPWASSARAGPGRHRPSGSRSRRRWLSRPTASRWAVARGSPVRSQSSLSAHGAAAAARSTTIALSSTPIPLGCPTERHRSLTMWDDTTTTGR